MTLIMWFDKNTKISLIYISNFSLVATLVNYNCQLNFEHDNISFEIFNKYICKCFSEY